MYLASVEQMVQQQSVSAAEQHHTLTYGVMDKLLQLQQDWQQELTV